MKKHKLVICIPTYNNPTFLREFFDRELPIYSKVDVGIYIADSSSDDGTHDLFLEYQKTFPELDYLRFSPDTHSNCKVYRIMQLVGSEIECDYLWIRSDARRAHKTLVDAIMEIIEFPIDIIVLKEDRSASKNSMFLLSDKQSLFEEGIMTVTLYGATILRTDSIIRGSNWFSYEEKYLNEKCNNFSHVGFLFERLTEINAFNAIILDLTIDMFYTTSLKKASAWHDIVFEIWLRKWQEVIMALPNDYKKREMMLSIPEEYYFSLNEIDTYLDEGLMIPELYEKYSKYIENLSFSTQTHIYEATYGSNWKKLLYNQKEYNELYEFFCEHRRIVIYGCGKIAKRYAGYLQYKNMDFEAFVVSEIGADCERVFMDHHIYGFREYNWDKTVSIVLALSPRNCSTVLELINHANIEYEAVFFPDEYNPYYDVSRATEKIEIRKPLAEYFDRTIKKD